FLGFAHPNQVSDDHETGADADPYLQPVRCLKLADSFDNVQTGPNGPLRIILVRLRVTEIDENAVAHILRNEAAEGIDLMRDTTVIGADDLAEVLWIHLGNKLRRANQIAKQDRDLAALGGVLGGDVGC